MHSVTHLYLCSPTYCFTTFAMFIQLANSAFLHLFISLHFLYLLLSIQSFEYPTANLSTSWRNNRSILTSMRFMDGSIIRPVLLRQATHSSFGCGFFCNGTCDSYLFAIFIGQIVDIRIAGNSSGNYTSIGLPQLVWSANRNNPVTLNSTLELTSDGDLILKDVDGTVAWSTNTGGKSVVGLNLTDHGNLLLFGKNNSTIWQSFDHPTDCLVPGQKLISGKKLVPSTSETNWTQQRLFSLNVFDKGMVALVESNPPQVYYDFTFSGLKTSAEPTYVTLQNGRFSLFANSSDPTSPDKSITIPQASSAQYARFCPDGHLRLYEWRSNGSLWEEIADMLNVEGGECFYPTVCGDYGICSNGQCACPSTVINATSYFKQINYKQPHLGCSEITPLSCEDSQFHSFIELTDTTYFTFRIDLENANLESCKAACSKNCSCKAAVLKYYTRSSVGDCYLPNQVFSLITNYDEVSLSNSTVYLKVQNVPVEAVAPQRIAPRKKTWPVIVGSSIGSFFVLLVLVGVLAILSRKKSDDDDDEAEEDNIEQVPGMLTRFSYDDLKLMTDNFSKVLGEGGFGTVFAGTQDDGTKVAVKRLNGVVQIKRSFLAEVKSIGSIHHMNLVRFLGFCAEKSHRILVYEFIPNGSLDKWIFCDGNNQSVLNWKQKKKIILDIAKGLTYLHQECSQKIIHMDIKPQNILLDHNFNAKICDFGLSKLIDRDQSKVVTTMRGTPGYMAPEWLSSIITEKIDVYSFGVVVLEILCGRRNIDSSQPEELMHLLKNFEKKQAENRLSDLVENWCENTESGKQEMMKTMKIATWCLQKDYSARPSMSVVVNVLEGVCEVEDNLSHNLNNPHLSKTSSEATPLLPFVLSGPR